MKFIYFILIGVLIGLIYSYSEIKKLVLIYRVPIRRIDKVPAAGRVQLIGKADTKNTKSLFKRTNCCLWQFTVDERRARRRGSHYWVTLYKEMSTEPFDLVDATGRVQIFPVQADLMLRNDLSKETDSITPFPPRINDIVQSLGIQTGYDIGLSRILRVREQIVRPGDDIFVIGEIAYENGGKVIKGGPGRPLIISDYPDYEVISGLFWIIVAKVIVGIVVAVVFLSSLEPA